MLCERCKKNTATVFYEENINGESRSYSLCSECASELKKSGKTGCPECYKTFGEELRSTIRSIHGNVKHIGRAPAKFRKSREKENELKELKKQLKEAIANENFESAANIRDKIRAMEKGEN